VSRRGRRAARTALVAAAALGSAATAPVAAGPRTPLVGTAFADWGVDGCKVDGTGIVATYDHPGVRRKVRLQLAAMHAAGLDTIRLLLWHDVTGDPTGGVVPSRTGRLEEPYRTNLVHYLSDIRAAGFDSLMVDFGPVGPNDPIGAGPVDQYDPSLFDQNWSFIEDVRPLVETYGPATTRIDLLSEGAPSDSWPYKQRMEAYITEMYRRYADTFGTDDVVVSAIAPPDPYTDITQPEPGHRLQNLIDALRASGRPLPRVFSVHVSTWWEPSAANTLYGLRQDDAVLRANGLSQPLIVSETVYDDPALAGAIATFMRTSSRSVLEVQEWPLTATSRCRDFSVAPPYRADAYIEALTGAPPDRTLTATVSAGGTASLAVPYGGPSTALAAGSYRLVVSDRSRRTGFRLVGRGVRVGTGARATTRTVVRLVLRRGSYAYGSGRRLGFRLVVL
jgi:hypothetical protein